ncbi:MAG TPA: hypothetical protein VLJ86_25700 [Ramlibacter sp.]|nr:hypothetical protein [Ramlibacter sp.]
MDIMIPVWGAASGSHIAASNLESLRGAAVALVDDNYDEVFTDEVELQLREQYGALVKRLAKPNGSHPSPPSLIEEAASCRVAVVGIGM